MAEHENDGTTEKDRSEETEATAKANDGRRLKELTLGNQVFIANGKEYFIEPHLSAERYREMQLLEIDLGFGMSFKRIHEQLGDLYGMLNDMNFADAAILVYNMRQGVGDIESRQMPILRYCAMFINTSDEDRRKVDEKVIADKIADWEEEGIEYKSFFHLAINMVNGLKESYKQHTQDISSESNK